MKTLTSKESLNIILGRHQSAFDKSFTPPQLDVLDRIIKEVLKALKAQNKLFFCGNGGSAADCQHIAAEFIARFKKERRSLPALALTTDTSILTAVANDYQFTDIFSRQIEGLGRAGDILFALSTSGRSKNVIQAVKKAREQKIVTIGFTGGSGAELRETADICFVVQAKETSHIQEMHITALHAISEVVEEVFFGS